MLPAWDLHYQSQILILEKYQRRVARWVLSDYSYHSSVSSMLEQLDWLPLILTAFKFHELATIAVWNLILMTPSILSILVS